MSVADLFSRFATSAVAALNIDDAHPRDPALAKMLGLGTQTTAGTRVDHYSVVGLPAVMRAVRILSNGVAKLPFYVFSEDSEGTRTFDKSHPAWNAITVAPNSEMSWYEMKKTMTAWAILYGNAVAYIRTTNYPFRGAVEFIPLLPDRTFPVRITQRMADRHNVEETLVGEKYYRTTVDGKEVFYHHKHCLHIKGLGPNPHWGYDVVRVLAEAFGGVQASQEFSNRYWGNGANPAGFIEMPVGLDEESEERFIASLKKGSEGMGRAHRLMVLEEGAKFHPWTVDPQKAQFLEGKEFDVRTIAMAIGVKVHKLIDSANSSFNSLEQANQEHKDDDLLPWVQTWRHELETKMLTAKQRMDGTHSIDVDDEQLEWVPFGERSRGVVELYNNGIVDKEEARRRVNFGPSKSPNARRYRKPSNIEFEDDTASVSVTVDDRDQMREQVEALERSHLERIAKRLAKIANGKAAKPDRGKDLLSWLDSDTTEQAPLESMQADVDGLYAGLRAELNKVVEQSAVDELAANVAVAVDCWYADNFGESKNES